MTNNAKTLLSVQLGTNLELDKLEDCDDPTQLSLMVMTLYFAKLLALVKTNFSGSDTEKGKSKIVKCLAVIMEHLSTICNECHYDFPEDDELADFYDDIPIEIRMDSILQVLNLIKFTAELANVIYVDYADEPPIWGEADVSDDFKDCVCDILVGIRSLCVRQKLSMADIFAEMN